MMYRVCLSAALIATGYHGTQSGSSNIKIEEGGGHARISGYIEDINGVRQAGVVTQILESGKCIRLGASELDGRFHVGVTWQDGKEDGSSLLIAQSEKGVSRLKIEGLGAGEDRGPIVFVLGPSAAIAGKVDALGEGAEIPIRLGLFTEDCHIPRGVSYIGLPQDSYFQSIDLNSAGEFALNGVPPGNWRLAAKAPGFFWALSDVFTARVGERTTVQDIELEPIPSSQLITGTVIDLNGQAVVGARLSCSVAREDLSEKLLSVSSSENSGEFEIALRVPTRQRVLVSADKGGYWPAYFFAVPGSDDVAITLLRPRVANLMVRPKSGTGPSAVQMRLEVDYSGVELWRTSSVRIGNSPVNVKLPPYAFTAVFSSRGWEPVTMEFDDTTDIEFIALEMFRERP